jgi:hypothetical protein
MRGHDYDPDWDLNKVRPVTRSLIEAMVFYVIPPNAATCDFGIKSQQHYEAIYYPLWKNEISYAELDAAYGNGPKLTELLNSAASNPHKGIVFETPWDNILPRDSPGSVQAGSEIGKRSPRGGGQLGAPESGGEREVSTMGIDKSLSDDYPSIIIDGQKYHYGWDSQDGVYLVENAEYAKDYRWWDEKEDLEAFLINLPESANHRDRLHAAYPDWHEATREQRDAYWKEDLANQRALAEAKIKSGTAPSFNMDLDGKHGPYEPQQIGTDRPNPRSQAERKHRERQLTVEKPGQGIEERTSTMSHDHDQQPKEARRPAEVFRRGNTEAAVWEKQSESGQAYHEVSIARSYRLPDGTWRRSATFSMGELPNMLRCADQAEHWIIAREQELKQDSKVNRDSEPERTEKPRVRSERKEAKENQQDVTDSTDRKHEHRQKMTR